MKRAASFLVMSLFVLAACSAEDKKPEEAKARDPETRKREYESVQKELEAARPMQGATNEEVMTYLELAKENYGKFARSNPRTAEGFEAASLLAELLTQTHDPEALTYSELAVTTAPKAGVDVKRVAMCWALVADGRLQKQPQPDVAGAKAAIESIQELDKNLYDQFSLQLNAVLKQMDAQREASEKLQPGNEPYEIEGKDLNGKDFSLAALKGKVVIIDFWATWCGPCMKEMPSVLALYTEKKSEGLEIVGISLDKDAKELKTTIEEKGIAWPILADMKGWQNETAQKWGVRSIPQTFVLDRKGVIRHIGLRGKALDAAVTKLLGEK